MLFVNTGHRDRELGAAFQQNSLQRVDAGDDAEVAFEAVPGRVFKAKVRIVVDAIAAGQFSTTPTLVEPETRTTAGRALAIIDVSDDLRDYHIPLGSGSGRNLHETLAPSFTHAQNLAADAQLAELRIPGRTLG